MIGKKKKMYELFMIGKKKRKYPYELFMIGEKMRVCVLRYS